MKYLVVGKKNLKELVVLFVSFLDLRWQWDGKFTEEKLIEVVLLPCTSPVAVAVVNGSNVESNFYPAAEAF